MLGSWKTKVPRMAAGNGLKAMLPICQVSYVSGERDHRRPSVLHESDFSDS
jgi:hypothetical protein